MFFFIYINIYNSYIKLHIKRSVQQHINFAAVSKLILRIMKKKMVLVMATEILYSANLIYSSFTLPGRPIERESWKESPIVDIGNFKKKESDER